jgi:tetratricopeptide (TPR) repeat protein
MKFSFARPTRNEVAAAVNPPTGKRLPSPTRQWAYVFLGIALVAASGYLISITTGRGVEAKAAPARKAPAFPDIAESRTGASSGKRESALEHEALADPKHDPVTYAQQMRTLEIRRLVQEAESALSARRFSEAYEAAKKIIELDPTHVEAHIKAGFALIGLERYPQAFPYLMRATDLDPTAADGYFGIAIVQEASGNLEGAIGGMRTFLHITADPNPGRLRVAQARSAIWEWEAKLGRGPWGPTKGIPPGFTEQELRRDGRGVGVKMQAGNSEDGTTTRFEIKSSDHTKIFDR